MLRTKMTTLLIFVYLLCPLIHILPSFSFPEHNSVTIRNILMILGRIIEQVSTECAYNSAYLFYNYVPCSILLLHFCLGSLIPQLLEIF